MRNIWLMLLVVIFGCSSDIKVDEGLKSDRWFSTENPKCEVWFQNWGEYSRLFITIESDTIEVNPSPYVTEQKDKSYLKPKSYKTVQRQQLIGNIYWDTDSNWDNGSNVYASWEVDRANPKISLPRTYDINLELTEDAISMRIMDAIDTLIQAELKTSRY